MPNDPRVEPEGKPTKPEVAPPTDRELLNKILADVGGVNARIDDLKSDVDRRLTVIEDWRSEADDRLRTSSLRVKTTSDNDFKQDGAIATILTTQATMAAKIDAIGDSQKGRATAEDEILTAAKSAFKTQPALVASLVISFVGFVIAALGAGTAYLNSIGHH